MSDNAICNSKANKANIYGMMPIEIFDILSQNSFNGGKFVLMLYVPVNIFSVMSGCFPVFLD